MHLISMYLSRNDECPYFNCYNCLWCMRDSPTSERRQALEVIVMSDSPYTSRQDGQITRKNVIELQITLGHEI